RSPTRLLKSIARRSTGTKTNQAGEPRLKSSITGCSFDKSLTSENFQIRECDQVCKARSLSCHQCRNGTWPHLDFRLIRKSSRKQLLRNRKPHLPQKLRIYYRTVGVRLRWPKVY